MWFKLAAITLMFAGCYQVSAWILGCFGSRKRREAAAHPEDAFLRANPALRLDQRSIDDLQTMLVLAGSGAPAVVLPFVGVGGNGPTKTVVVAFSGVAYDLVVEPMLRNCMRPMP